MKYLNGKKARKERKRKIALLCCIDDILSREDVFEKEKKDALLSIIDLTKKR